MATSKLQMQYDLRQNSNEDSTAFGKWYPQVVVLSTLNPVRLDLQSRRSEYMDL